MEREPDTGGQGEGERKSIAETVSNIRLLCDKRLERDKSQRGARGQYGSGLFGKASSRRNDEKRDGVVERTVILNNAGLSVTINRAGT